MVILSVVSIGFYLWNKNHSNNSTAPQTASPRASAVKAPTYAGSTLKLKFLSLDTPPPEYISISIPDGWVADKDTQRDTLFFADDLTYKAGTKFSYSDNTSNKDIERFMLSQTDADDVPKEYKTYQKSDFGTVSGNKVTLYYHEFSPGENIGNVHMEGGEKEYMYFMVKGTDAVMVSYYILAGDKDQTSLIDQVIRNISF